MNHVKSANMAQAQALLDYLVGQLLNEQMVNVAQSNMQINSGICYNH